MKTNWIILTSRTGKTAETVQDKLNKQANIILSTKEFKHDHIMDRLIYLSEHEDYRSKTIITLMGYMRIVTPQVCSLYDIYNLHPGPIHVSGQEFLKGKDPIERSFKELNEFKEPVLQGSVIHKVVSEVDCGEIISSGTYYANDIESSYNQSFSLNVKLWTEFLKKELGL